MTMVERVARALCAKHYAERFGKPVDDPHVQLTVDGNWRIFADDARVAIEAMREPTDAMTDAIWEETGDPCWRENAVKAWQAGISTALAEPQA